MKTYLYKLLLFIAILVVAVFLWNTYAPEKFKLNSLWFVLVFYSCGALLSHFILSNGNNNNAAFIRKFMAVTFAKMFIYLFVAVIFALFNREKAVGFLLAFLVFYFIFTPFEVYFLLKQAKKQ